MLREGGTGCGIAFFKCACSLAISCDCAEAFGHTNHEMAKKPH
jgi:hypothetical protein